MKKHYWPGDGYGQSSLERKRRKSQPNCQGFLKGLTMIWQGFRFLRALLLRVNAHSTENKRSPRKRTRYSADIWFALKHQGTSNSFLYSVTPRQTTGVELIQKRPGYSYWNMSVLVCSSWRTGRYFFKLWFHSEIKLLQHSYHFIKGNPSKICVANAGKISCIKSGLLLGMSHGPVIII